MQIFDHFFRVILKDFFISLIVPYPHVMAGLLEGVPGDVEPAVAGEELVSERVVFQERYQALELGRILWSDVGSLTLQVL